MKQIIAMIKKENSILFKNIIAYLSTLIIPTLLLFMNIYMNSHTTVKLNVGINSQDDILCNIIDSFEADNIILKLKRYTTKDELISAYKASNIDAYITVINGKDICFNFDSENTKGQLIYSYLANAIQNYVGKDLQENNSDIVYQINSLKKYNIVAYNDIKIEKKSYAKSTLLLSGILWIILYTPLSTATAQITVEKKKKTLYLLYKAPVSPFSVIFSKFTAVYLQFLLSISLYLTVAKKFDVITGNFNFISFILLSVVLITVSSLGHCLGLFFFNDGVDAISSLVLVLPVIIMNSIGFSNFDFLLRLLPTYYCAQIVNNIVNGNVLSISNIIICILFALLSICIFCFSFRKRDAIKLCTYLN